MPSPLELSELPLSQSPHTTLAASFQSRFALAFHVRYNTLSCTCFPRVTADCLHLNRRLKSALLWRKNLFFTCWSILITLAILRSYKKETHPQKKWINNSNYIMHHISFKYIECLPSCSKTWNFFIAINSARCEASGDRQGEKLFTPYEHSTTWRRPLFPHRSSRHWQHCACRHTPHPPPIAQAHQEGLQWHRGCECKHPYR